jgi:hypothetical protein
MSCGR